MAGINGVEWDAVRAAEPVHGELLLGMGARAGDDRACRDRCALPARNLFERMLAARNFQSGMFTAPAGVRTVRHEALHSAYDPAQDSASAAVEQVRDEVVVNRPPTWSRFLHQFSHIFAGGYAAGATTATSGPRCLQRRCVFSVRRGAAAVGRNWRALPQRSAGAWRHAAVRRIISAPSAGVRRRSTQLLRRQRHERPI